MAEKTPAGPDATPADPAPAKAKAPGAEPKPRRAAAPAPAPEVLSASPAAATAAASTPGSDVAAPAVPAASPAAATAAAPVPEGAGPEAALPAPDAAPAAPAPRTAGEVAAWMQHELATHGRLHQPATVAQIQEQFGPQFLEPTPDGGWAIAPEVLVEFVRSTPDGVVWDGRACLWRTREPADPPGARVVG